MRVHQGQFLFFGALGLIAAIPVVSGVPLSIQAPLSVPMSWGGLGFVNPAKFTIGQPASTTLASLDNRNETSTRQPIIEHNLNPVSDWRIPTPNDQTTASSLGGLGIEPNDVILAEFAKLQINGVPKRLPQNEMGNRISSRSQVRSPLEIIRRRQTRLRKYYMPTQLLESLSKDKGWLGLEATLIFYINPISLENISSAELRVQIQKRSSKERISLLLYGVFDLFDEPLGAETTLSPLIDSVDVGPEDKFVIFHVGQFLKNCPKEFISGDPRIRIRFILRRGCDAKRCDPVDPDAEEALPEPILAHSGKSESYLRVHYSGQVLQPPDLNNNLAELNNNLADSNNNTFAF